MRVSEVRIKLMSDPQDRLLAFCSITFDSCFVIRDLKGDSLVVSPPQQEYFPVYYSVTSRIDQVPLGLDLNSSPARRAAIAKARSGHGVSVTERVRVMGVVERESSGVVMLAPVYDGSPPSDERLRGFVVSVLSLNLEMEAAIAPDNLPASMPAGASAFYARNISALLLGMVKDGNLHLDFEDEVTKATVITKDGSVIAEPVAKLLNPEGAS